MTNVIVLRWNKDDETMEAYKKVTDVNEINSDDLLYARLLDVPGEPEMAVEGGNKKIMENTIEEREIYRCPECNAEITEDDFECFLCKTPLEWEEVPVIDEAANETVLESLEKEKEIIEREKEKEVLNPVDTP